MWVCSVELGDGQINLAKDAPVPEIKKTRT